MSWLAEWHWTKAHYVPWGHRYPLCAKTGRRPCLAPQAPGDVPHCPKCEALLAAAGGEEHFRAEARAWVEAGRRAKC
jgi:hypothetical protein